MPWTAEFKDGPMAEETIEFGVGEVLNEIYFAPTPERDRWIRVGDNNLKPEPPWPDQVRYLLQTVDYFAVPPTATYQTEGEA